MNSPERINPGEVKIGASEAAAEQAERLRKVESSVDKNPEKSAEHVAADARKETETIFAKERGSERANGGEQSGSATAIRKITKREKQRVYKQTLKRAQAEMNAPARTFSKIIHSPAVEKASDAIGGTIARPNALLVGGGVAFLAISILYVVGQTYGYRLSGFEMIGAYVVGWVVGILVDYFRIMATGKVS